MARLHLPPFLLPAGLAVLLALVALAIFAGRATEPQPAPAPHFWSDPALRTIVIAGSGDHLAKKGDILLTNLVEGRLPAGATQATVLSDANCEPDAQGISHCLNQLRIGDALLTVQHHHDMTKVPCLGPGEKVNVVDVPTFEQL